jgi:hypothetical protein
MESETSLEVLKKGPRHHVSFCQQIQAFSFAPLSTTSPFCIEACSPIASSLGAAASHSQPELEGRESELTPVV